MARNIGAGNGVFNVGTFGAGLEWLQDFIFDRFRILATNPLSTNLFRNLPNSQRNGQNLTQFDTNVKSPQVPVKQKWYLWNLFIAWQTAAAVTDAVEQAYLSYTQATLISFKIENLDVMFSAPLSFFRPTQQIVTAPAATVNSRLPMQDNQDAQKDFKIPQVLEENAIWYLTLDQQAASAASLDNSFLLFAWDREMYRLAG